jgi:hypothetical protein
MKWPNKISMAEPAYSGPTPLATRDAFYVKQKWLQRWCMDNLSSVDVLWTYDVENLPGQAVWHFYFAQSEDAVMFRLVNGV